MSFKEWKKFRLEEIVDDIAMGPFGSNLKVDNFISEGVPVIRGANLNDGGFDDKNFVFVSEAKASSLKRSLAYPDDLVFTHRGTIGQVGIIPSGKHPKYLVSQSQMRLTVSRKYLLPKFLYYFFRSPNGQYELLKNASQVGVPAIASPTKALKQVEIDLPPLATQERIASILSALDDKIELNRQTNTTLEAIAQTIFKEWFVYFKFPSATGEMVDSELGMIPIGWKVAGFEDELEAERGLSYKGAGLESGDAMPMHNLNSVYEGGGYKFEGIKYYSGEYKEKHIIRPGDLIVTNTEQGHKYLLIGYPAIVPSTFGEVGIYSHHIYRLRQKLHSYITADFVYQLLLQPAIREQVVGFANGTTVNMLKIEGLQKPRFVLPPKELVSRFSEIAMKIRLRQEENIKESATLTSLRDLLLPKLMNGEIEV